MAPTNATAFSDNLLRSKHFPKSVTAGGEHVKHCRAEKKPKERFLTPKTPFGITGLNRKRLQRGQRTSVPGLLRPLRPLLAWPGVGNEGENRASPAGQAHRQGQQVPRKPDPRAARGGGEAPEGIDGRRDRYADTAAESDGRAGNLKRSPTTAPSSSSSRAISATAAHACWTPRDTIATLFCSASAI
jgi:hypothetical protein